MLDILSTLIYQPFLNLVVFFYWFIGKTPLGYDMGIAVILLTISIRVLLLPITLASQRSESERRAIHDKIVEVNHFYASAPVERKEAVKRVLRQSPRILFAEVFMFFIQLAISLILWRIFANGLHGEDLHLLYGWMPTVPQPYELDFLGRFDLTHPDLFLNVVQTALLFALETVSLIISPYPVSRQEVVRVQLVLPLASFAIFAFLPAGKKLFVITAISFSLVTIILHSLYGWIKVLLTPPPVTEGELIELPASHE